MSALLNRTEKNPAAPAIQQRSQEDSRLLAKFEREKEELVAEYRKRLRAVNDEIYALLVERNANSA